MLGSYKNSSYLDSLPERQCLAAFASDVKALAAAVADQAGSDPENIELVAMNAAIVNAFSVGDAQCDFVNAPSYRSTRSPDRVDLMTALCQTSFHAVVYWRIFVHGELS